MRSELWDAHMEEYLAMGGPAEQAWARVISRTAFGGEDTKMAHWWWVHVTAPCLPRGHPAGRQSAGALVDRLEGVPAAAVPDASAVPPRLQQSGGGRGRGGQRQGGPQLPTQQPQQRPAGPTKPAGGGRGGQGSAPDKASGICNLWNDKADGCRHPGPCRWGRRHVCRVCQGPHRAIHHE